MTEITKAMSQKRAQDGSTTEANLRDYNHLKKELFVALPKTERAKYQKKASDHKDFLQGEPDPSHVFEFVYQTIRFFELAIYLFPEIRRLWFLPQYGRCMN